MKSLKLYSDFGCTILRYACNVDLVYIYIYIYIYIYFLSVVFRSVSGTTEITDGSYNDCLNSDYECIITHNLLWQSAKTVTQMFTKISINSCHIT